MCKHYNGDKKNPKAFSADNDMDPGDVPPQMKGMTQVEQMLIAKVGTGATLLRSCEVWSVHRVRLVKSG